VGLICPTTLHRFINEAAEELLQHLVESLSGTSASRYTSSDSGYIVVTCLHLIGSTITCQRRHRESDKRRFVCKSSFDGARAREKKALLRAKCLIANEEDALGGKNKCAAAAAKYCV